MAATYLVPWDSLSLATGGSDTDEFVVKQVIGGAETQVRMTRAVLRTGMLTGGNGITISAAGVVACTVGGFITGSGVPTSAVGADGYVYLNADATAGTGDVYQRAAGVWSLIGNIRGATGPAGSDAALFGTQGASQVWAAPLGASGSPGWRQLGAADLSDLGASQSQSAVFAAPASGAGAPSFRSLTGADIGGGPSGG